MKLEQCSHVNDFSEKIKSDFELSQFADDISIPCRYEPEKTIATKIENFLLKTDSYLKENQLTLNADKADLLYLIKPAESCCYLGIHLDSKMTFAAHLKSDAADIRSLYLLTNHIPLEVRLQFFKSLFLSHLSFRVYLKKLSAKNIQRVNRKINWGIKECYMRRNVDHCRDIFLQSHVLTAELIISKFGILKLQADLSQITVSETFKKCANRLQLKLNKWTKQLIIRTQKYKQQSKRSLILISIQKWNNLPSNVRATAKKPFF